MQYMYSSGAALSSSVLLTSLMLMRALALALLKANQAHDPVAAEHAGRTVHLDKGSIKAGEEAA